MNMTSTNKNFQTLTQKKGEVRFREKISQQHLGKRTYFRDELDSEEMQSELRKRIAAAREDFSKLAFLGVHFSPFLEIGAEYGVRASVLENEFNARGFALDIARAPLEAASVFTKKLKLAKLPRRICADCYHLPFKKDSFSFVFCYQTLHHFPDPLPIVEEIKRVLKPNGFFFFGEEPIRQNVNLRLFRRSTKTHGFLNFLKYFLLLPFISQIGKTEADYGILEETFSISTWEKILSLFPRASATISPYALGPTTTHSKTGSNRRFIKLSLISKLLIFLLGGGVHGLGQKKSAFALVLEGHKLADLFQCPTCQGKIFRKKNAYLCTKCKTVYKITKGVIQFLPRKLNQELYPLNVYEK